MFIQVDDTPNPESKKFIPGVEVLPEDNIVISKSDIGKSPLADSILEIDGIVSVFLATDFISVTKDSSESWEYLQPVVLAGIMDHFVSGLPVLNEQGADKAEIEEKDPVKLKIMELIETHVRPAVAQDGGDIIFRDFYDGTVYLELRGACSGCPSSTITLKHGIENMLKHYLPEVQAVEQI